jgi:4'-phosphopantetheinyl transferase
MRVVVSWDTVADAEQLLREVVGEVTGYDPGPVHHTCPQCGSVEHGRPYVEAPVDVSIAHAPGMSIVAVSEAGPVGVDLEKADREWVRKEAAGKAHGTGILVEPPPGAHVVDLDVPGFVAALATLRGPVEVRAAPRRTTTPGTAHEDPAR